MKIELVFKQNDVDIQFKFCKSDRNQTDHLIIFHHELTTESTYNHGVGHSVSMVVSIMLIPEKGRGGEKKNPSRFFLIFMIIYQLICLYFS